MQLFAMKWKNRVFTSVIPLHRMFSGAGHDAQYIASFIPSAMIFVPSIGGKSHCEEEETTFEDCAKGADVLLETVLALQTKFSRGT